MNAKKKGDKYEKECCDILRKKGLLVLPAQRTMKRIFTPKGQLYVSQANDFYGLFDLMYRNPFGELVWVQVKSDMSDYYKARKDVKQFYINHCNNLEFVEFWIRVKRKGFKIYRLNLTTGWELHCINLKGEVVTNF